MMNTLVKQHSPMRRTRLFGQSILHLSMPPSWNIIMVLADLSLISVLVQG